MGVWYGNPSKRINRGGCHGSRKGIARVATQALNIPPLLRGGYLFAALGE